MRMAGLDKHAGEWAFHAGFPGKIGGGGGLVSVIPGRMEIDGFFPRVNEGGNSIPAATASTDVLQEHHATLNLVRQIQKRPSLGVEGLYGSEEDKTDNRGDVYRIHFGVLYAQLD